MILGILLIVLAVGITAVNLFILPGGVDVTLLVICLGMALLGCQRLLTFSDASEEE